MLHQPDIVGRPIKAVALALHFSGADFQHHRSSAPLADFAGRRRSETEGGENAHRAAAAGRFFASEVLLFVG